VPQHSSDNAPAVHCMHEYRCMAAKGTTLGAAFTSVWCWEVFGSCNSPAFVLAWHVSCRSLAFRGREQRRDQGSYPGLPDAPPAWVPHTRLPGLHFEVPVPKGRRQAQRAGAAQPPMGAVALHACRPCHHCAAATAAAEGANGLQAKQQQQ
jgi:hypothetical protein